MKITDPAQRVAALTALREAVHTINAKEAERLRLAGMKRVRQGKRAAKGMAT